MSRVDNLLRRTCHHQAHDGAADHATTGNVTVKHDDFSQAKHVNWLMLRSVTYVEPSV
jgi:hypothetical protein